MKIPRRHGKKVKDPQREGSNELDLSSNQAFFCPSYLCEKVKVRMGGAQ